MPKTKVEVYNKDQLIYPFIESDHVTFSNGMKVSEMLDQSISMPKVIHEDLSFKVGVGDQDVSSAIVDSSVAEMTIKGKTYQNILPEPSTHILTNDKGMFKVNEGLDPNVEIVDGVSKSAILKGNTLVNLFQGHTSLASSGNVHTTYNNGVYTYQAKENYEGSIAPAYMLVMNLPYKPIIGKTYTVFITQITGGNSKLAIALQRQDGSAARVYNEPTATSGLHKFTFTHDYEGEYGAVNLRLVSYTADRSIKFKDIMIIEGDWTNVDIPYFTGMTSCKAPVLTTVGKNLFNYSDLVAGEVIWNTSNNVNIFEDGWYREGADGIGFGLRKCIKVKPNTRYYANFPQNIHFMQYKANGDLIKGNYPTTSTGYVTTSSETHYVNLFPSGGIGSAWNEARRQEYQNCYISESEAMSSCEPYKSNILHTPEEVVLSKVNDAIDTLNLNTKEYVKRVKEIVLDGSEPNSDFDFKNSTESSQTVRIDYLGVHDAIMVNRNKINCDKFLVSHDDVRDYEHIRNSSHEYRHIIFYINKSRLSEVSLSGFKEWLSQNPVTIQYELATPTIKIINLSSSGNWEKVILDGSEDEGWRTYSSPYQNSTSLFGIPKNHNIFTNPLLPVNNDVIPSLFSNHYNTETGNNIWNNEKVSVNINAVGDFFVRVSKSNGQDVERFKQYLQQNPMTVWYQTKTHKDSTQVKQPIFFKDGRIQLSSGVENSLIPTLDYQAKTSNSYVMDLMKANTRYTMKAKSANGTFTIDGTSYGAGTNGTFTTPSSMTNKFLIMSNKTNEEVMILEGDVVSKTIPYFKGIKSAFEDEDKIEVLSTGKNLIDETLWTKSTIEDGIECLYGDGWYSSNGSVGTPILISVDIKQGKRYRISVTHKATTHFNNYKILQDCLNNRVVGGAQSVCILDRLNTFTESNASFVANFDAKYLMVDTGNPGCYGYIKKGTLIIEEIERDGVTTAYEPYKSNSTKIPLLSPLRSLPNGVCDELIVDRMKKKATLIQRVGICKFDSKDKYDCRLYIDRDWAANNSTGLVYRDYTPKGIDLVENESGYHICNSLTTSTRITISSKTDVCVLGDGQYIGLKISNDKIGYNGRLANDYLSKNPVVVYYQLATPVITEVDLEGFPYIYKDGHIFLNSEIAPTTEIIYSINQCQQISASNEDIIRHEKELTYLQKLIAQYVQVDYESALLSLKV